MRCETIGQCQEDKFIDFYIKYVRVNCVYLIIVKYCILCSYLNSFNSQVGNSIYFDPKVKYFIFNFF